MFHEESLRGRSVVIAGAGLAGLTASVELHQQGAQIFIFEARDRIGGRVWTMRDGFFDGQHAEAGGDLIDADQEAILRLAARLGLEPTPILRRGFSLVRQGQDSRPRVYIEQSRNAWAILAEQLEPWVREYCLADQRWDSVIAQAIARISVAERLDQIGAGEELRALVLGLRGFFLADPHDLSLLALVDQLASQAPGRSKMYRIKGGNDRLASAIASLLGNRVQLRTTVLAASQTSDKVQVTVCTSDGEQSRIAADYLILAVPATTLRAISFNPPLPPPQQEAILRLQYGRATRTLLQFGHRFWRKRGRPKAFGTNLSIGAVWDGNEEQGGRKGILSLLAGASASEETRKLIADYGIEGFVQSLDWLGAAGASVLTSRMISWEDDPWVRGGYAVFDPAYDAALRYWLARPHGRILFAGEHTSFRWQGYMNGAVESGLRAAAEIRVLASHSRLHVRSRS